MQKQEFGHIYPVVLTSRLVSNAYLKGIKKHKNSRHALKHSAFVLTACFPSSFQRKLHDTL